MRIVLLLGLMSVVLSQVNSQKVFEVKYESRADVKVFVVEYESQADLLVYKEKYESGGSGNEGDWYFCEYESRADKSIYFVNYSSRADLKICYVNYDSRSGWRNKGKKSLMQ